MIIRPFHLAIPVRKLEVSKNFYVEILGCSLGRSSKSWVDLNFFHHQLVLHQNNNQNKIIKNEVDSHNIPIPHFGVILSWDDWHDLSNKLNNKIEFEVKPHIRFEGKIGEQATMFFRDPDGNALEFKAFKNDNQIFEK
ncbi:MAG: glyoxalase [Candidatus Marinimicrobia bacterium]|nr:glyoxalase [Candidatus Neomarinimicrobiota bacterium]|tara:strand:- start:116 stop:529 length:414 start_codon:yes stop_codon:yes gene_type:complete